MAELSVCDSGQGIRPEFLPYVFDRFRQAESSSHLAFGGLGLGLAIVRHLVELLASTVRLPVLAGDPLDTVYGAAVAGAKPDTGAPSLVDAAHRAGGLAASGPALGEGALPASA